MPSSLFKKNIINREVVTPPRGFTLVEMIVSLAVFSVVAVVALGALVKIVSANRKAQTLQTSITNLNFALDAMSREMRTGGAYTCEIGGVANYSGDSLTDAGGCRAIGESSDATLVFRAGRIIEGSTSCARAIAYRFVPIDDTYELRKAEQVECAEPISDGDFISILDSNLKVVGYYLNVEDAGEYPLATIRISGYAGTKEREKTYFNVQTSVAPHVAQ
ncbi:MAG: prepilin-type N-terminal cleavage/methylation domain-containing protein [Candidatus Pacebacteria bacterium]|nr:prepilin-type N-terminal cleavage/methylation domain-containing protein [Candidatus Paceibacterota bacterium]